MPILLMAQASQTTELYQENRLWGLKENTPITPAVYDTLISISQSNNYIAIKHGKGSNATGVISSKGKVMIPFQYWKIIPINGFYIVSNRAHNYVNKGVINYANKTILPLRFKEIKVFNNNWYAKNATNQLQLFSKEGNLIKTINADSVAINENTKYLKIYKQGKLGLLDAQGTELFKPEFKQIKKVNGAWITTRFATWQLISNKDTTVISTDSIQIWDNTHIIRSVQDRFYVSLGNNKISNNYRSIHIVSNNLAITKKTELFGVINKSGKEIMPPQFSSLHYNQGYFYAQNNKKWSIYDSLGHKRSVFKYDSIGKISNGLFPIKRKGKWGFMNRDGKEVIHCIYSSNANFKKGKAIINYFGASGIIDLQGKWIVKPRSEKITDFSYNFYIYKKEGIYYLSNYNQELIYFTSNKLVFKNETIYEIRDGYSNRISSLGTLTKNEPMQKQGSNAWQIIKIGNKYGFEDLQGVLKITYRYDSLLLFSEGQAAFKLRGKWGFINEQEEIDIQPIFTHVTSFKNGLSIVSKNNKSGLIRLDGSYSLKPKFETLLPITDDLWLIEENKLKGIYDSEGKLVVQPIFKDILFIKNDFIIVVKNHKYGVVNNKGQSMIPRIYDFINYDFTHNLLITKQNL